MVGGRGEQEADGRRPSCRWWSQCRAEQPPQSPPPRPPAVKGVACLRAGPGTRRRRRRRRQCAAASWLAQTGRWRCAPPPRPHTPAPRPSPPSAAWSHAAVGGGRGRAGSGEVQVCGAGPAQPPAPASSRGCRGCPPTQHTQARAHVGLGRVRVLLVGLAVQQVLQRGVGLEVAVVQLAGCGAWRGMGAGGGGTKEGGWHRQAAPRPAAAAAALRISAARHACRRHRAPVHLRLSVEFQWFFTALSVRPGSSLEMTGAGDGGGGGARRVDARGCRCAGAGTSACACQSHRVLAARAPPSCASALTRPLVAVLLVRLDDHCVLPLTERVLLHLRVQLVAPPAVSGRQGRGGEQQQASGAAPSGPGAHGCTRSRLRPHGAATPPPHLRRQLLPDRPRMPLAMMDQFLGPYSPMSWRSRSSSCGGGKRGGA